jgi:hypothetical protein
MYSDTVLEIKSIYRWGRRVLGLSPIQKIFKTIESQGFNLSKLDVLEAFAGDGRMQVVDYYDKVRSVDLWEWTTNNVINLWKLFPNANIEIVDTFDKIKRTTNKYDLIVLDASPKSGEHWEVFDLFPDVFQLLKEEGIIICTLVRIIDDKIKKHYPEIGSSKHNFARQKFYDSFGDDNIEVSKDLLTSTFAKKAGEAGFRLVWDEVILRNSNIIYYVLRLEKDSLHRC